MPSEHLSLKEISQAYDELVGLRAQVEDLQNQRASLMVRNAALSKSNRELRLALGRAERESPMNPNDEALLFESGIVLSFERRFSQGKRLVARTAGGRKVYHGSTDQENKPLLPAALKAVRHFVRRG